MSFRKPSPRTLLVVDLATRKVVATRDENMNGGCSCAKITKPIYEAVKSGKAIMFYAHRPDDIRIPVEINGRYFAKPSKWVPKAKVALATPSIPKVRKFIHKFGFGDGTSYVEYDGKVLTAVKSDGTRWPVISWEIDEVERWIKEGNKIVEVTP